MERSFLEISMCKVLFESLLSCCLVTVMPKGHDKRGYQPAVH